MKDEYEGFHANIWEIGKTKVITIDKRVITAHGLKNGDLLKVLIKRIEKAK